jgi:hypothetical protein
MVHHAPCSFGLISRISSHPAVFFSHNKPANNAFNTINQRNEQADGSFFFVSSRRKAQSVNPDHLKAKQTYTEKSKGVWSNGCFGRFTEWPTGRVTAKARKGKNRRSSPRHFLLPHPQRFKFLNGR